MEMLNEIWNIISPYVIGGITVLGTLLTMYKSLSGAFNKTIKSIDVKKISEQATEKGLAKIKEVSFKQSIQPLVVSELKKVTEIANDKIIEQMEISDKRYNELINIVGKLANYFDASIGVTENSKQELHNAIENAKISPNSIESIVVEQIAEEKPNVEIRGNSVTKISTIVR